MTIEPSWLADALIFLWFGVLLPISAIALLISVLRKP